MARKTQQVETKLVSEYVKNQYGQFPHITKQPLGLPSPELLVTEGYEKGLRMQRPLRFEVDAIVMHPKWLILIEGKVWHIKNGVGDLIAYRSLVPFTPELKQYLNREVLLELVVPWTNPNLEIMCRDNGIRLQVYHPEWINEVANRVQLYGTRDYRTAREAKLRDRELLGLE